MKKSLLLTALVILLAILPYPASSQSWNVELTGTCYNLWSSLLCVEISGNYAYLGTYGSGLRIVDISDSTNLREVGFCAPPEDVSHIAITGNYAYMVARQMSIADISDPTNPVIVGTYGHSLYFYEIAVAGSYIYAATIDSVSTDSGLTILDISEPTDPQEIGFCAFPPFARCIAIVDHYVYVGTNHDGIIIIDVLDPYSPFVVTQVADSTIDDIAVSDTLAYATCLIYGLHVFDISNPSQPVLISRYAPPGCHYYDISVYGDYACITDEVQSMYILSISNPRNPYELGHFQVQDGPLDVVLIRNTSYLARFVGFFYAIDITDPTDPTEISHLANIGVVSDIAVTGGYAVTANYWGENGLRVIDVSNPLAPIEVGKCTIPYSTWRAEISGSYVFVGHWASYELGIPVPGGVRIIDISDPTNPFRAGAYESWNCDTRDIAIQDTLLYVWCYPALRIVNISNPTNPTEICSLYVSGGYGNYLGVAGNYVYISGSSQIAIVDASDPFNPYIAGYYNPTGDPLDLVASGQYAYLATGLGLTVLDISDPLNPQEVGFCSEAPNGGKLVKSGHHVLSETYNRFWVVDVSDPTNPTLSGYYDTALYTMGIDVSSQYAYVGNDASMSIYDCSAALPVTESKHIPIPTSISLYPAYPNPFNPTTLISFSLPAMSNTDLKVYDLTGRHVQTLINGWQRPGTHSITFNGSTLSSGIYFCRLSAGGHTAIQKMVLIK